MGENPYLKSLRLLRFHERLLLQHLARVENFDAEQLPLCTKVEDDILVQLDRRFRLTFLNGVLQVDVGRIYFLVVFEVHTTPTGNMLINLSFPPPV